MHRTVGIWGKRKKPPFFGDIFAAWYSGGMHKTTLNPRQQEAVRHTEGPLLVLAGAGAGKTKTITHRILHLVARGAAPAEILAITFTNKAAGEMRARVRALLKEHTPLPHAPEEDAEPFVATFHALGVYLLRHHAREAGLSRHFPIYDRTDSLRAIKAAMEEAGIDPQQYAPRTLLGTISRAKGEGMDADAYAQAAGSQFYPRMVADVWRRYRAALRHEGALDFDDLLLESLALLRRHEDLAAHYQQRWRWIHVDEYQDTNAVQYEMVRLLAARHRNLCCVGDIDQNIYAWRGATIDNILHFERDYPDAKVVLLEENYRSTKTIIAASNEIIEKNVQRRKKTLFTRNEDGEKIALFAGHTEGDEARWVADTARTLMEEGVPPQEIAVLYRANFQSRALEEAFLTAGVPYQVLGVRFFDRKEVKDVVVFLRAALARAPQDIARIAGVPPRGIGKATLVKMLAGDRAFTPAVRKKVAAFEELLDRIAAHAAEKPPHETLRFIVEASGLEAHLKRQGAEGEERLENIRELVSLAARYAALPPEEGVARFLDDAALASEQDALREDTPAVRLMTVHAAKGLEFAHVFITGLEEGLFPHEKTGEQVDEEEERRLFYVALTRAKARAYLTYAHTRAIYGARQVNLPSQFIGDIDPGLLEEVAAEEERGGGGRIIVID